MLRIGLRRRSFKLRYPQDMSGIVGCLLLLSMGCDRVNSRQELHRIDVSDAREFIGPIVKRFDEDQEFTPQLAEDFNAYVQPYPTPHSEIMKKHLDYHSRILECAEFEECVIEGPVDDVDGEAGDIVLGAVYKSPDGYSAVFFTISYANHDFNSWIVIFDNDQSVLEMHIIGGS